MDPRERFDSFETAMLALLDGFAAGMWTGGPGVIEAVNLAALTCVVQPAIMARVQSGQKTFQFIKLPLLLDVPLIFPRGGGYSLTFPVAAGDECFFLIADRAIDSWWQSGGVQRPTELRMHDLSDAFALVGPYSQPQRLSGVSTSSVQLRSNDATISLDINHATGTATLLAPTSVILQTPLVQITGALQVLNTGSVAVASSVAGVMRVTGEIIAGYGGANISITTHYHTDPQGGDTGAPVAGS